MSQTRAVPAAFGSRRWELPPLILHPFSDQSGPGKLLESSRASLMLSGMMPTESDEDELTKRLLEGRLCEVRMLFFVGKDLMRWMTHCAEFVNTLPDLEGAGICDQSFADLLVQDPPPSVKEKLRRWGVLDYRSIFSRAIALNTVFATPPEADQVSSNFVRNYYRFADHLYICRQQMQPFTQLTSANFYFEIYASGEYSRMLEQAWERE